MSSTIPIKCYYAHCPGSCSIAYASASSQLLTTGSDGELRAWSLPYSSDDWSISAAESCMSMDVVEDRIFVGTGLGSVEEFSLSGGEPKGTLMQFSLPVTFITHTSDNKFAVASSEDFDIKRVSVNDRSDLTCFSGHTAPVLALSCSLNGSRLCSSSCDGSVKVWCMETKTLLKSISLLPKCNDIESSKLMCRHCWAFGDKSLLIPCELNVTVLDGREYRVDAVFASIMESDCNETCHSLAYSKPLDLIAAGSGNGRIQLYDSTFKLLVTFCIIRPQTILQMVFLNDVDEGLCFVTKQGYFGFANSSQLARRSCSSGGSTTTVDKIRQTSAKKNVCLEFGDRATVIDHDTFEISLEEIKKDIDKKYNSAKTKSVCFGDISDNDDNEAVNQDIAAAGKEEEEEMQAFFHPSSTPSHVSRNIMVWNNIGIVVNYKTTYENSIDVEFHENARHHNIHFNNDSTKFRMAALSEQILVLASSCRVRGIPYASWSRMNADWELDQFTDSELVVGIATSNSVVVVLTSFNVANMYTIAGRKLQSYCINGHPVSMTLHDDLMAISVIFSAKEYSCLLMSPSTQRRCHAMPLHNVKDAYLTWMGFDESSSSTLYYCDNYGYLRLIDETGNIVMIQNTQKCKNKSVDQFWPIAVNQDRQEIRGIWCRAEAFPSQLVPRPIVSTKPLVIQSWGIKDDQEQKIETLEDEFLTAQLFSRFDDCATTKEALLKLFMAYCKKEMDLRACELLVHFQRANCLHVALKCAHRLQRGDLVRKISDRISSDLTRPKPQSNDDAHQQQPQQQERRRKTILGKDDPRIAASESCATLNVSDIISTTTESPRRHETKNNNEVEQQSANDLAFAESPFKENEENDQESCNVFQQLDNRANKVAKKNSRVEPNRGSSTAHAVPTEGKRRSNITAFLQKSTISNGERKRKSNE